MKPSAPDSSLWWAVPTPANPRLLNALVGQKVAIVADKPQTTRTSIQGVLTLPTAQIVFLDTPGIHKRRYAAQQAHDECGAGRPRGARPAAFPGGCGHALQSGRPARLDVLRKTGTPAVLVLNKVDLVKEKARLLPLIEQYKNFFEFADYVPVSAIKGDGLDELRKVILEHLPEGPAYFPEDHVTDQPERFLAAELIREKVLQATRQEVPHAVAVMVDQWEETPRLTRIFATIRVERPGQKAIVIGAKGAMLKKIGTLARQEMERLFGVKIYLDLHVRVQPGWRGTGRLSQHSRLAYNGRRR